MSEIIQPIADTCFIDTDTYHKMYQQSITNPEVFWAEQASKYLTWEKKWERVLKGDLIQQNVTWFEGGELNVCYNCVDRHLPHRENQPAIIWEGDDPDQSTTVTYGELLISVSQLANGLKSLGVGKGDRVCIYIPMIVEGIIAMLACARIGAIHSVVFAGFSAQALKARIQDAECKVVITADENIRGGKKIAQKANVDSIINKCPSVKSVVVVKYSDGPVEWLSHDIWYHELISGQSIHCPIEVMKSTDPLFLLYTSGSTGKPKGILHAQAGYCLHVTMSFKLVFNYQEGDVYWSSSDIGWITAHSYIVYGPLSNGATTLVFAGVPTYPTAARFWQVIDKHKVNIFYTSPTAIRSLIRHGDDFVKSTKRNSLKLLATVGEPINPVAWKWFYDIVGEKRCPVIDTWWQTETGGVMLTGFPGATPLKPGSVCWPNFGVQTDILDDNGQSVSDHSSGNLVIKAPWPGQLQTIYGDSERCKETYYSKFPGYYFAGDNAYKDDTGYYWVSGRNDDVINVSGHRLDTAEIESVVVAHPNIIEAAVVGFPHPVKGQGIYIFATPKNGIQPTQILEDELIELARNQIGPIATPDVIQWADDLPKTRSGKIMRRILRKIVNNQSGELGDISTLSNPEVVAQLIDLYKNK